MKVLVTGGSGFIGSNLVANLIADGVTVMNFDAAAPLCAAQESVWQHGSILDASETAAAFADFQPTHVVHLAARTDCDESCTVDDYRQNTDGTRNVLDAVRNTPSIERLIVTSTQFVCRPGYKPKHDEDFNPHTIYGQSKVITEQLTRRADLSCVWTMIRPTTIWGPWLLRHRDQFFRVLKRGLYLHPGGRPCMRSWGYVGNVVFQIRRILELPADEVDRRIVYVGDPPINLFEWVNGASLKLTGKPVRKVPRALLYCLAMLGNVVQFCGLKAPLTTSRYRSMTEDYLTPMDRTLELVGDSPYSMDEGLDETMRWIADPPSYSPRRPSDAEPADRVEQLSAVPMGSH